MNSQYKWVHFFGRHGPRCRDHSSIEKFLSRGLHSVCTILPKVELVADATVDYLRKVVLGGFVRGFHHLFRPIGKNV